MDKKKIIIALIVVVLLIVAIFTVITIRKVSVFNNLLEKASETDKTTNFHMIVNPTGQNRQKMEVWSKDETHYLVKMATEDWETIFYQNGEESFRATNVRGQKQVKKNEMGRASLLTFTQEVDQSNVWKEAMGATVRSIEFHNKNGYEIKRKMDGVENTIIVEKATGLVLKDISSEISYEIGTVTDADVQKPDLTGYTEINEQ